jgi:CysZ protein
MTLKNGTKRSDMLRGFKHVLKAFSFAAENNLWAYFIIPLVLDGLLAASLFVIIYQWSHDLTMLICQWIGLQWEISEQGLSFWEVLKTAALWAVEILIWILSFLLYASFRKNILVLLLSPMMSWLSEKTFEKLSGQHRPFNGKQLVRDLARSAMVSLRNLLVEIGLGIGVFLLSAALSLIGGPLAFLILPLLSLVALGISSYYFGCSLLDYSHERNQLNLVQTIAYNRKNKWAVLGIGLAFNLLLLVPVFGISLALVMGTIGATTWHRSIGSSDH